MIPWFDLVEATCKIASAVASILTLGLMWRRALPVIDKIKTETNAQTAVINKIRKETTAQTAKIEEIHDQTTNGMASAIAAAAAGALKVEAEKVAVNLQAVAADVRDAMKKE